ncbi:MAG: hypothetical protein KME35_00495 [Aphanocapsa sp. GSE-SYN-MK-11-07L]|jgi:hypothetical protein|nr:hypothetical protein [Aphanocapsa sp. GSE-SYN-MK-11-07L]
MDSALQLSKADTEGLVRHFGQNEGDESLFVVGWGSHGFYSLLVVMSTN